MKRPVVSIVLPTYNRGDFIGKAIQSVLEQTYKDFELIVVDDASEDNTGEIVNGFTDHRITYIQHDQNEGGSAARNTGIKRSKGDYIGFLDSDDLWLPTKLEKQLQSFRYSSETTGLVYTGAILLNQQGEILKKKRPEFKGNIINELYESNVIGSTSTVLIKSECFTKVGLFDEKLPSRQDLDMWIRIARHYDVNYIPEFLTRRIMHEDQISKDLQAKIRGRELLYEKIEEDLKDQPKKLARYHHDTGITYFKCGSLSEGRTYLLKALRNYFFPKSILALLTSYFGRSFYLYVSELEGKLGKFFQSVTGE